MKILVMLCDQFVELGICVLDDVNPQGQYVS